MTQIGEKGTTYYKGGDDRNGRPVHKGTRQSWQPGDKVNVGFVRDLHVHGQHPSGEGVHLSKGDQHYKFIPHQGGLQKISKPETEYAVQANPQHRMMDQHDLHKTAEALKTLGAGKPHGST